MELIAQDQLNIKKSGSCADTFAYVLAVVLVAWLIFLQLCSISVTSGGSMLNTISDGDVLISYKTTNFDRGDVTTLWSTQAEKNLSNEWWVCQETDCFSLRKVHMFICTSTAIK